MSHRAAATALPGVQSVVAFIRLLPMSDVDKNVEILALRHQLVILQRQIDKPRLTLSDRAFLAALLHRLPRPTLRQLHLIVSPDTGRRCVIGSMDALNSSRSEVRSPGRVRQTQRRPALPAGR
jgi:putative transposase